MVYYYAMNSDIERLELLGAIVRKVENILSPKPIHIWHIPGALQRVISSILAIFYHGYKKDVKLQNNDNLWSFVFGLRVLRPDLWPTLELKNLKSNGEKFTYWLQVSLSSHAFRKQIKTLIDDKTRMCSFYFEYAFLRDEQVTKAFLIVLDALESNSQDILANIDPNLMVTYYKHRKLSDELKLKDGKLYKENAVPPKKVVGSFNLTTAETELNEIDNGFIDSLSVSPSCLEIDYNNCVFSDTDKKTRDGCVSPVELTKRIKTKRRSSTPKTNFVSFPFAGNNSEGAINCDQQYDFVSPSQFLLNYIASKPNLVERRQYLPSSRPVSENPSDYEYHYRNSKLVPVEDKTETRSKTLKFLEKKHVRSYSDGSKIALNPPSGLKKVTPGSSHTNLHPPPRFMEDGGHSIATDADGFFPHPQPGQNLLEFLASPDFSAASAAQLDRENVHFSVAEAVLAAIEQMNFEGKKTNSEGRKSNRVSAIRRIPDESEDDFFYPKRNRRKTKLRSRASVLKSCSDDEPATTDYSMIESAESSIESDSSVTTATNEDFDSAPAISSSASDEVSNSVNLSDPLSAENVAIAILRHYNTKLLPQANELQWLVTEQDAPQKLLPMPNSVAISPDDADKSYFTPLLRGTSDWAPPRPQLILTLHNDTKKSSLLMGQKWRCAGCGHKVSKKLSRHFRLCHYLGRYFCTVCHNNKKASIPARVLHKWDFNRYAVSNFSFELLCRMKCDPLFHLASLNSQLYRLSRDLHQTHIYRLQLFQARVYINICSRALKEKALLVNVPTHWYTDPHLNSMEDLLAVKSGQLVNQIKHLTVTCIKHISSCKVCLGQGFICEICKQGGPIFPFQLDAVSVCDKCGECFHFVCYSTLTDCPRCKRRENRSKQQIQSPS